jgi:hypothetical protein
MRDFLLIAGLLAAPFTTSVQQYRAEPAVDQNDPRLSRLTKFFADRDCPLRDSAMDFLVAADQNELDWRLLPSISIIESSGGKDYTNNNVFGWDSWKIKQIQGQKRRPQAADLQPLARVLPAREGCYASHGRSLAVRPPTADVSRGLSPA